MNFTPPRPNPEGPGFIVGEEVSANDGRVMARFVIDHHGEPERRVPISGPTEANVCDFRQRD